MASNWAVNWEAISALGTLAAVVVALYLASADRRRLRRDGKVRAHLYAASMTYRLSYARKVALSCQLTATFNNLEISIDASDAQAIATIKQTLRMNTFRPNVDELQALIPLGNNCAHRIARAFDYIDRVRQSIENVGEALTPEIRAQLLAEWRGEFGAAVDLLTIALRDCEPATELGAPTPTGQELYGDRD